MNKCSLMYFCRNSTDAMGNGKSSAEHIESSKLVHVLDRLSNMTVQSPQPKRTIKLNIFPDSYDKTIFPPLENGNSFNLINMTRSYFS